MDEVKNYEDGTNILTTNMVYGYAAVFQRA
jgi:hypothetical protein